jgi:hypothetical protein
MNPLLLALSLSSSFTKVGAIAAFLALVGIAILSLLVFAQAREIKRLRDWAGRAPERAAELEQRVSTEAAARMQRSGAPPAPQGRVVPRATPLVSAPVSTAVNASAAAARVVPTAPSQPASAAAPGPAQPSPSAQPAPAAQTTLGGARTDGAATVAAASPPPSPQAVAPASAAPNTPAETGEQRSNAAGSSAAARPAAPPSPGTGSSTAAPAGDASPDPLAQAAGQAADAQAQPADALAAPATAAARSVGRGRSPLPPSPSDPRPAAPKATAAPAVERGPAATVAARAPSAVAAASPVASRTVREPAEAPAATYPRQGAPRPSSPRAAAGGIGAGRKDYRGVQRSPARATLLVLGGVVVLVLVLVLAVTALKGGGKAAPSARTATGGTRTVSGRTGAGRGGRHSLAARPSEVAVAVLNGTSTVGLAHHLAADLLQSGYTQALASAAVPPGTHQTTVVQYASGHRADAQAVARALNVTQVQPLEGAIAAQAGSATVVVLAGADQAALLGGGGAHSQGEPAASGTGTGAPGEAGGGQ